VDHRGVERVLDLVRDARGEGGLSAASFARVIQRGLHLAQVLEVARDEHDAQPAVRAPVGDIVRENEPVAPLRAPPPDSGPKRLAIVERGPSTAARYGWPIGSKLRINPELAVKMSRAWPDWANSSVPSGPNSATASSRCSNNRFQNAAARWAGDLRANRPRVRALTALKRFAEVAEGRLPFERSTLTSELTTAESREGPPADDVDRPHDEACRENAATTAGRGSAPPRSCPRSRAGNVESPKGSVASKSRRGIDPKTRREPMKEWLLDPRNVCGAEIAFHLDHAPAAHDRVERSDRPASVCVVGSLPREHVGPADRPAPA